MSPLRPSPEIPGWLGLGLVLCIALAWMTQGAAYAQPAPEAPVATEAPVPGPAPAAGNALESGKVSLAWIIKTSGLIGAFLLVISLFFVATVIRLFLELREAVVAPRALLQECEALLARREFTAIYKLTKENSSELGQLIATGMASLSAGLSEARESMERLGDAITVDMERRISMLAVVGTLGPLIGLLGTLKGMISSFSVIAMSDTQLKPSEVASGISEALVLTFEGVGLSVPAIYFFALFKNRVAQISVRTLNLADDFVRRVHYASLKKTSESAS